MLLAITLSCIDVFYGMGFRADYTMNFNSYRHNILARVDCCVGVYTWQVYFICFVIDLIGATILLVGKENPVGYAVAASFTVGLVLKWYLASDQLRTPAVEDDIEMRTNVVRQAGFVHPV
ncbi:hypothetical protein GUITHDRAFT_106093 [Guillardia theta CCMP2712]|uniref:Uncharacterized protein n=1 Tax=Guillardia theta (strain CCMP2712) TaxID=905079 RepID=L1JHK8_GUITC|nr:hypothetical protein GUITHDRAFT_106093 [Guillardia theta CCMP2712]EKX48008.1 hypothetical protein GUITHDRAFT_106093 [Guillardia theta CCMP2712]|eukprot:XP_005834988.1 hypothetical protein GUITHDRAFT_106093 [Guillardia theta CCMP2712]